MATGGVLTCRGWNPWNAGEEYVEPRFAFVPEKEDAGLNAGLNATGGRVDGGGRAGSEG